MRSEAGGQLDYPELGRIWTKPHLNLVAGAANNETLAGFESCDRLKRFLVERFMFGCNVDVGLCGSTAMILQYTEIDYRDKRSHIHLLRERVELWNLEVSLRSRLLARSLS
jgi:hypothetical protein